MSERTLKFAVRISVDDDIDVSRLHARLTIAVMHLHQGAIVDVSPERDVDQALALLSRVKTNGLSTVQTKVFDLPDGYDDTRPSGAMPHTKPWLRLVSVTCT